MTTTPLRYLRGVAEDGNWVELDPGTMLGLLDRLEAAEAVAARVEALIEEREAWAAEKSAELRERWPNSSWRTYAVGAVYGTADLRAAIEGKP